MEIYVKKFYELNIDELYDILKLRVDTFVVEQECFYPEIDGKDKDAMHVYIKENNEIVAYLRVLDKGVVFEDVAIGRVVSKIRRQGIGTKILNEGIKVAKEVFLADKITIEAQTYVKSLYEAQGFVQTSDEFLEDGIPHIKMELKLK